MIDSFIIWQALQWLRERANSQFASNLISKEMILSPLEVDALISEQRAAVDVVVLEKSTALVGLPLSSMSFFIQELRALSGYARNTTLLVANRMNEPLFNRTMALYSQ